MTSPNDLCLAADVAAWLNPTQAPSVGELAVYARLISAASQMMLSLMGRTTLNATTYTEQRNGNNSKRMALKQRPVLSVASLSIDGYPVPASPDGVTYGYVHDDMSVMLVGSTCGSRVGMFNGGMYGSYSFARGFGNVQIVYSAGYPTVPYDVAQACIELVGQKYRRRAHIDEDSQILSAEQTLVFSKTSIPLEVREVIETYKIRFFPT